jgi:hypothetical protein
VGDVFKSKILLPRLRLSEQDCHYVMAVFGEDQKRKSNMYAAQFGLLFCSSVGGVNTYV